MILVISNVANESASALVEAFEPGAASLITASNIHTSLKAAITVRDFASSALTVDGRRLTASQITGVVTTVAYFVPQEFYYVEPADRNYVCAEVRAFFIYLLSQLPCPKLNPPSSRTLSGLGMHRIEWMKAAHGFGVPVGQAHFKNGEPVVAAANGEVRRVRATIIGDSIVEEGTPARIREYLSVLSRSFGMPYLCGDFVSRGTDEYQLADLWSVPDITSPANRDTTVRFMNKTIA